jgi:hypothetical protein
MKRMALFLLPMLICVSSPGNGQARGKETSLELYITAFGCQKCVASAISYYRDIPDRQYRITVCVIADRYREARGLMRFLDSLGIRVRHYPMDSVDVIDPATFPWLIVRVRDGILYRGPITRDWHRIGIDAKDAKHERRGTNRLK